MARPRNAVPSVEKRVSLPEDLCAILDLQFYSQLEGRIPYGAWSRYLERLIRQDLATRSKEVSNDQDK